MQAGTYPILRPMQRRNLPLNPVEEGDDEPAGLPIYIKTIAAQEPILH